MVGDLRGRVPWVLHGIPIYEKHILVLMDDFFKGDLIS